MAQAVLDFSRAAGKARAVGARRRNGLAMRTLAWQARWRGDFDAAESFAHRAMARLKDEGAEPAMADVLATLSIVHCARGRRDLARECADDGFRQLSVQPNTATRIDLLIARAIVERCARRMEAAQDTLREAMALSSGPELARTEQSVARSLLHENLPSQALEHARTAVSLAREHGNRVILPYALEVLAAAMVELGRFDRAATVLHQGEIIAAEEQDPRAECQLLYHKARLTQRQGDPDAALALAGKGLDCAAGMGFSLLQKMFLECAAQLQEDQGQTVAALDTLKRLIALLQAERE